MPHSRLREALADALELSGSIAVVGRVGGREEAVRAARDRHADAIVLASGLLGGSAMGGLDEVVGALGDARVVVVGLDDHRGYARAVKAAGAVDYVVLDGDLDALLGALRLAV